jgi:hypothetical protein
VNDLPSISSGLIQESCRGATHARYLGAYIFYAIAMIYDSITTAVSIFYLFKYKTKAKKSVYVYLTSLSKGFSESCRD